MSKKRKSRGGLTDKIRSSLVLKLNLRILAALISAFIGINILTGILFLGTVLWKTETGTQNIVENYGLKRAIEENHFSVQGFEVSQGEDIDSGIRLPDFIQNRLPLEFSSVRRKINTPRIFSRLSWNERIQETEYQMTFSIEGRGYVITYPLFSDLQIFTYFILIILVVQLLYLLDRIGKNTRVIRKTLKPLTEMAQTARTLHEDVTSLGSTVDGKGLKNLAGAIKTIDADRLDQRISVDSSQDELKDLAYAINDMLKRIRQSYESQVRFVSDASHELRTPISVIQGYAGLLDRWGKEDEKTLQESITAIKSETDSMQTLVEQLLFLARGDNETIQLHKDVFSCREVVQEMIKETRLIDSTHLLETELNSPGYVYADRQLIKQAVRILVDNSIKYTPAGEKIIIRVFGEKDKVKIQVQDHGIGIAPEDVSRVFDRFYRSDESRARKTGGAGLGLAIARWIIERHEGHFEVISRVDIGTRTTIILPAAGVNSPGNEEKEQD